MKCELDVGRALDHYEVAKIISDATEKTITYYPISEEEYAEDLKSAGMPDDTARTHLIFKGGKKNGR